MRIWWISIDWFELLDVYASEHVWNLLHNLLKGPYKPHAIIPKNVPHFVCRYHSIFKFSICDQFMEAIFTAIFKIKCVPWIFDLVRLYVSIDIWTFNDTNRTYATLLRFNLNLKDVFFFQFFVCQYGWLGQYKRSVQNQITITWYLRTIGLWKCFMLAYLALWIVA